MGVGSRTKGTGYAGRKAKEYKKADKRGKARIRKEGKAFAERQAENRRRGVSAREQAVNDYQNPASKIVRAKAKVARKAKTAAKKKAAGRRRK